jgi:hypothetical protein
VLKYSFKVSMLLLSDGDNLRDDKCAEGEGGVSSTERIAGLVLSVDELEIRVSRFKKEKGISKDEVYPGTQVSSKL